MKTLSRTLGSIVVLLLMSLSLMACQPIQPETVIAAGESAAATEASSTEASEIPQITITAQDFAFEMPAEIPAGLVSITFTNEGAINHHGYVMRLLEGITLEQVKEAMATEGEGGEEEGPELNDLAFFLPDTDPGKSNQVTLELVPGNWLIVSFSMDLSGSDGPPMPDWARGSIQEFTVTEAGEPVAAPEADLTVTIGTDDFDMPAEVTAGEQTIQVVNNSGAGDGYLFFVKLGGNTTMEDVLAAFEAMFAGQPIEEIPIITTVGGLMGHNLGESYYTTINFEPGNYAAVSSINGVGFPYEGLYKNFAVK
jgi:hypothetical protein